MQRKATRQTRGPNAAEKRFHAYTKESDCICCGNPGPSIVHHCEGSCMKHNKVLIGHWFVVPLCLTCDDVITQGSRKAFRDRFGAQSQLWRFHVMDTDFLDVLPFDVLYAINDWNK
jgi:hypothetical protein